MINGLVVCLCVSVQPRALIDFLAHEIDWEVRFIHFSTASDHIAVFSSICTNNFSLIPLPYCIV